MAINQGRYNVFNEDGTIFKWGKENISATVTPKNRVQIFIGDNMEPVIEKHIPSSVRTVNDFDKFTHAVCSQAKVRYVVLLVEKLHKFQEAYELIMQAKALNQQNMFNGVIPVWRWIERVQEINEYQETCETLLMETMGDLFELSPETLTASTTFVFTGC